MRSNDKAFACPICGSTPVCVQYTDEEYQVGCPHGCIEGVLSIDCLDAWDSYRDAREQAIYKIKNKAY